MRTSPNDLWLAAETLLGQLHLRGQLRQVVTAHVAQLDPFEVVPDALVRVEVRRVAGQPLQMEAVGGPVAQEVFDDVAAMDRRPIPDHGDVADDLVEQSPQESQHAASVVRRLLHLEPQAPIQRNATDDREMVTGERDMQHWRLARWRPGADRQRQQVKRGLVYPDDGGVLFVRPFLSVGQRSTLHCWIASSLRCVARVIGCCRLQPNWRKSVLTWSRE